MRKILLISFSALLLACNPLAKLPSIQTSADEAFNNNDFENSYTLYKQYIQLATTNGAEVSDDIYHKVAIAAGELKKLDEASEIYNLLLKKKDDTALFSEYAQLLQENNQVSEEIELWKNFDSYDSSLLTKKTDRLIHLYNQTESYDAVIETVATKGNVTLSKEATMKYISALENADSKVEAAKVCNQLVKEQPDYTPALEWKGQYYYEKADARYKAEMAKYNKNKNATTYAYLLRDLKKVSADFRVARDTFEHLRQLDAENKSYIKYLKNCYLRLEQKAEAAKMDRLLK